ncbi:hypothetical protein [Nonomuraea sp. NEAU-A123]|nr:hypothetical protein [Nonomuraea sp. NEAU-A123]MBT2232513.1 hypothetical protein [Nonomuraea sp. NEAU-A123]
MIGEDDAAPHSTVACPEHGNDLEVTTPSLRGIKTIHTVAIKKWVSPA